MRAALFSAVMIAALSFECSSHAQQPTNGSSQGGRSDGKSAAPAADINACKYLIVTDFDSDPYGIAKELRAQARSNRFTLVQAATDLAAPEMLKACTMTGSWERWVNGGGGSVAIRVTDVAAGVLIAEAAASGISWWGPGRTVRELVKKLYAQLRYAGYSEAAFVQRMQRLYPPRPKLAITEAEIKSSEPRTPVEGVWSDSENKYRLGIVKAPEGSRADYVAVVLESTSPTWQVGEIKAEIRTTASRSIFICTYFLDDKKPGNTTVTFEDDSVLRGSIASPNGPVELLLVRVWPKATD